MQLVEENMDIKVGVDSPEQPGETPEVRYLTPEQLLLFEESFADWVAKARGRRSSSSRNRCRLVFSLLRHTGAKLGEVLAIDDREDFDLAARKVRLGGRGEEPRPVREVSLPHDLQTELAAVLGDADYAPLRGSLFALDQGYMRRVIYERAKECGLPKHLANPNTLRRSRGIELLRGGMPLGAIQRILGHLTANSTAAFLEIPSDASGALNLTLPEGGSLSPGGDSHNAFVGKVATITPGDLQSLIEVETLGGHRLVSVLSNDHLKGMCLRRGSHVTVRIRPPRLARDSSQAAPGPNRFRGVVERILTGADTAEVVVLLEDGARVSSVVTPESLATLRLKVGETVWAMTGAFSITISAS